MHFTVSELPTYTEIQSIPKVKNVRGGGNIMDNRE